jgi:hypothetical protein
MGLLTLFKKSAPTLLKLPAGSFTVDREGSIIVDTLPSSFPSSLVVEISTRVLGAFRGAAEAHLPLAQLTITYTSLRITARELRGGAIVFLSPKSSTFGETPSTGI